MRPHLQHYTVNRQSKSDTYNGINNKTSQSSKQFCDKTSQKGLVLQEVRSRSNQLHKAVKLATICYKS
jgi:hypothetical protein